MKARLWRTVGARAEEIEVKHRQHCSQLDGWGHQCYMPGAFALAWTVNESGLPGLGEEQHDIVCVGHVGPRLHQLGGHAFHITVTPYQEIS